MSKSTFCKTLLVFAASAALACFVNPAFAQRGGGGSHGGGGFHGGGGGGGFHGGGGFSRGGGGGSYSGGYRGGARAAAPRTGGGFYGRLGGYAGGLSGRSAGSTGGRSAVAPPSNVHFGAPGASRNFGRAAGAPSSAASRAGSTPGQWHSFRSASNGDPARAMSPAPSIADGRWHSFGNPGRASGPAAESGRAPSTSVGSSRSLAPGRTPKSWSGQGHTLWANTPNSRSSSSSNRATPGPADSHFNSSSVGTSALGGSRSSSVGLRNSAFSNVRLMPNNSLFGTPRSATGLFNGRGVYPAFSQRFDPAWGFGGVGWHGRGWGGFGWHGGGWRGCLGCGWGWNWAFGLGWGWGWGWGWGFGWGPGWGWAGYWDPYWYEPWWAWPNYGYYPMYPPPGYNVTYPPPYSSSDSTYDQSPQSSDNPPATVEPAPPARDTPDASPDSTSDPAPPSEDNAPATVAPAPPAKAQSDSTLAVSNAVSSGHP